MSTAAHLRAHTSRPLSSFMAFGIVTTLLYFALYNLARGAIAPVAANVLAWCVCLAVNFILNSRISFRDRSGDWRAQLGGYLAVYISSAVVTTVALSAFVTARGADKTLENALLIAVQVVLVFVRYCLLSTMVFRREPAPTGAATSAGPRFSRPTSPDIDGLLVCLLAAFGALVAAVTVTRRGIGEFYQSLYEPAVRFACGHRLVEYSGADRALDAFLAAREGGHTCSAPPEGGTLAPSFDQAAARYLQLAVGLVWRVVGVSWESLMPLYALLAAGTAAALYGLARLLLPKLLAAPLVMLLLVSPLHTFMLPQLRDYAKAPFLLGAFLATALLVRHRRGLRTSLLLAAGAGALVGIGFGFRADALLAMPLFVAAVGLFWPGGPHRDVGVRILTGLAFFGAFVLLSMPVRAGLPDGGNSAHWAVLGLSTPFTQTLGLEQDLYDQGYLYNDTYALSLVNAHAYRTEDFVAPVPLTSSEAEEYGKDLLLATASTFPADLLARGYAAAKQITELPIESASRAVVETPQIDPVVGLPVAFLASNRWISLTVVALALMVGAARRLRLALLAAFAIMYLGAVSALQFDVRHVFHLEGIGWLAGAFLLVQAGRALHGWRARRPLQIRRTPVERERSLRPVAAMAAALLVATAGLLVPARAVQASQVDGILRQLQSLPRDELALTARPVNASSTLLALPETTNSGTPVWSGSSLVRSSYLVARVRPARCGPSTTVLTWRYRSATNYTDFSRTVQVPPPNDPAGAVDLYFLGLRGTDFTLTGLELATPLINCVETVSVLRDTDELPLLVNATLPQDWSAATPFQTFRRFEDRRSAFPPTPQLLTSMAGLAPAGPGAAAFPLRPTALAAPGLQLVEDGWSFRGRPETGTGYVAASAAQSCPAEGSLTLLGAIRSGAASIGVQQNGQWVGVVTVTEPGPFIVVLNTPVTGSCSVVLAHAGSVGDQLHADVTEARFLPVGGPKIGP